MRSALDRPWIGCPILIRTPTINSFIHKSVIGKWVSILGRPHDVNERFLSCWCLQKKKQYLKRFGCWQNLCMVKLDELNNNKRPLTIINILSFLNMHKHLSWPFNMKEIFHLHRVTDHYILIHLPITATNRFTSNRFRFPNT